MSAGCCQPLLNANVNCILKRQVCTLYFLFVIAGVLFIRKLFFFRLTILLFFCESGQLRQSKHFVSDWSLFVRAVSCNYVSLFVCNSRFKSCVFHHNSELTCKNTHNDSRKRQEQRKRERETL